MQNMISTDPENKHGIDRNDIERIISNARKLRSDLSGRGRLDYNEIVLAFFEPSTRTRTSFEMAAHQMGANTTLVQPSGSSMSKGEDIYDTCHTLLNYKPDVLVIRSSNENLPYKLADSDVPIINAGNGTDQHPTQALLDIYTLCQKWSSLKDKKISIIGDVAHSRVARSNVFALLEMGANVVLGAPEEFLPDEGFPDHNNLETTTLFSQAVDGADAVMILRVQEERLTDDYKKDDYLKSWQVNEDGLTLIENDAYIMHPGPVIDGITDNVLSLDRCLVNEQVKNGLAVRKAILNELILER